jgi:hypothetical protein
MSYDDWGTIAFGALLAGVIYAAEAVTLPM